MNDPRDARLLSFLEGSMGSEDRARLLDDLEADPELSTALREAARGLDAMRRLEGDSPRSAGPPPGAPVARGVARRVSPWWAVAASAATLLVSWPLATLTAGRSAGPPEEGSAFPLDEAMPPSSEPSFVLVLHGTWPDAGAVGQDETTRRAQEYWSWTGELARSGTLVAAGDLRWEPGERLGPAGALASVEEESVEGPDFVVGMLAVRAATYEEALAVARGCPHLQYGGSVSVRRVGAGFVTVPGMDDWAG